MSAKLEQITRRMFDDVWNRGDVNALSDIVADDYVNHDPINAAQGTEGMKALVAKYRSAFPDARLEIESLLTAGQDHVVVRWNFKGTHRGPLDGIAPTGRTVHGSGITQYRFAGDRIKEGFTAWDALGLMQQLGVVTLPGKTATRGA
jgi:steroid delta-isomerase-like uncharacterized protein